MFDGEPIAAKISTKGQIVIPLEMRQALQLTPGTQVVFRRVGSQIIVEALRDVRKREKGQYLKRLDILAREVSTEWERATPSAMHARGHSVEEYP